MNITQILTDLQSERDRIDTAITALTGLNGDAPTTVIKRRGRPPGTPKKRTMSASARKRISERMKERWAEKRRK